MQWFKEDLHEVGVFKISSVRVRGSLRDDGDPVTVNETKEGTTVLCPSLLHRFT